jgi:methyltransferase (TIGR00027 family)
MSFDNAPPTEPGQPGPGGPAPSLTSQVVALIRAELIRPHSADGDPDAQRALCAGLTFAPPAWLRPGIATRTTFMDEQVMAALGRGVRQVVIFGAGLDDRALRFRTAGVRFFELDHPATQADKARRLHGMSAPGPTLAPCDFQSDSVEDALAGCGHAAGRPTLFLCEGLLVYLDRQACLRLLAEAASRAAPGSTLAASLATCDPLAPVSEVVATANARRRTGAAEPWRTILPRDEHLALLADAGWTVTAVTDSPSASDDVSHGRRSILVVAAPALTTGSASPGARRSR